MEPKLRVGNVLADAGTTPDVGTRAPKGSGCKLSRTCISACFGTRKDKANVPRENLVNFTPGEEKTHALLKLPKRSYSTVKSFSMKIRPRRSFMFLDFPAADGLPPKADENRDHAHVCGFLQPRENQSKNQRVADKKLRQKITANSRSSNSQSTSAILRPSVAYLILTGISQIMSASSFLASRFFELEL